MSKLNDYKIVIILLVLTLIPFVSESLVNFPKRDIPIEILILVMDCVFSMILILRKGDK